MIDLKTSPLFEPWTHPVSGVTSYLLTRKVAPVQEAFYFVNNGWSDDGRFLWFYCAFPPSGSADRGRTLGVVDFEKQTVAHHPDTQFEHGSPWVDPATGELVWGSDGAIHRRSPDPNEPAALVNRAPEELVGQRRLTRTATHLTPTADGRAFFIDAEVGLQYLFGTLPIDGGDFELWHRFDRHFNHAQCSPTDPDLVEFSMENHFDQVTGLRLPITDRLWLMRRGEAPRPIRPEPTVVSHEWWDEDGEHVWCIKGGGEERGTWRVNIHSGERQIVWPDGCWHSHHHPTARCLVGDNNFEAGFYRGCPSTVDFFNRDTARSVRIIDNPARDDDVGARYHIDPHPRFCVGGRYIVHTTAVRGQIDLAVTPTDPLIDRTA